MKAVKIVSIFFTGLLVYGVWLSCTGFHNLDVANDIERVLLLNNIPADDYYECSTDGYCYSLSDTYMHGLKQMMKGFWIVIIGAFGTGLFFPVFV